MCLGLVSECYQSFLFRFFHLDEKVQSAGMVWRSERKATALYSSACWTPGHSKPHKLLKTFRNRPLWGTLEGFRHNICHQWGSIPPGNSSTSLVTTKKGRCRTTVGRACWMSSDAQPKNKMALSWTADGTCRQDCPKETWKCRTGEKERKECNLTYGKQSPDRLQINSSAATLWMPYVPRRARKRLSKWVSACIK